MEFLRNTNFDFMKYRRFWLALSAVVMAVGLVAIFFLGRLNLGIDFAGGTQLTLKFAQAPDLQELRSLVAGANVGEPQIQRFGAAGANEVMVPSGRIHYRYNGQHMLLVMDGSARLPQDPL